MHQNISILRILFVFLVKMHLLVMRHTKSQEHQLVLQSHRKKQKTKHRFYRQFAKHLVQHFCSVFY